MMRSSSAGRLGLRRVAETGVRPRIAANITGGGRTRERDLPGRHLVEHGAEAEEIAARVERLGPGLLRRHVADGAERRPLARQRRLARRCARVRHVGSRPARNRGPRQAEVEDLRLIPPRDEDVGGLDVPVHDAMGMGDVQGVGELNGELEQQVVRERLPFDEVAQRHAFEQLHDDERLAPVVLVDVVDGADVRMIQRGGGPRFAVESLQRVRLGDERLGQELQGNHPREPRVLGLEHDAHAAAAQSLENPVMGDGLADHGSNHTV